VAKFPTEKGLVNLINDLTDKLMEMERGDPAHIPISAQLMMARRALQQLKKDKAR
jgi:hypothetical protein